MRIVYIFIYLICFITSVFAQDKAVKFDEFVYNTCGQFNARMDSAATALKRHPNSKLYVFYYGEKNQTTFVKEDETGEIIKFSRNPHPEDAVSLAKEVPLYLKKVHKVPDERIVLVDGGFRDDLKIELWLVPEESPPPDASPIVDKKDVVFSNRRNYRTRDCYTIHGRFEED